MTTVRRRDPKASLTIVIKNVHERNPDMMNAEVSVPLQNGDDDSMSFEQEVPLAHHEENHVQLGEASGLLKQNDDSLKEEGRVPFKDDQAKWIRRMEMMTQMAAA